MLSESLLKNIVDEEMRKRRELEAELDRQRTEKLAQIIAWREEKIANMTREDLKKEWEFWRFQLINKKWELENLEGKAIKGPWTTLQRDIDNYLDENGVYISDLEEMPMDELLELIKKELLFAGLVLNDEIYVYARYLSKKD